MRPHFGRYALPSLIVIRKSGVYSVEQEKAAWRSRFPPQSKNAPSLTKPRPLAEQPGRLSVVLPSRQPSVEWRCLRRSALRSGTKPGGFQETNPTHVAWKATPRVGWKPTPRHWHASHSSPRILASNEQAIFSASVYCFLAELSGEGGARAWPVMPRISFCTSAVAFSMLEA